MKICPQCQTKYTDETLNYCLQDGKTLDHLTDDKTLVLDAESFASDETISDNFSGRPIAQHKKTEELRQNDGSSLSTQQNQSIETIVDSDQIYDSAPAASQNQKKGTGIGFFFGFVIALLVLGSVGAGFYVVRSYSNFTSENSNSNSTNIAKEKVISDSSGVKVSASSSRRPEKGNLYTPQMAFDGNPRTAWSEGVKGAGKRQWIAFDFVNEVILKEIVIQPGYFKTPDIWRKNNRVSSVVIEFSDKSTQTVNFPDVMKEQTIDTRNIKTKSVFIAIKDIKPGATDSEDTLISEVKFVVK